MVAEEAETDRSSGEKAAVKRVRRWLEELPVERLGAAAEAAGDGRTALFYFEQHIAKPNAHLPVQVVQTSPGQPSKPYLHPKLSPPHLDSLQKLHANLGEHDSVVGALHLIRQLEAPSNSQWILAHEASGNLTDALPYYQRGVNRAGLVQCLLRLNQPALAQETAAGGAEADEELAAAETEATWKMGDWEGLKSLVERERMRDSSVWGAAVGRALAETERRNSEGLKKELEGARRSLLPTLMKGGGAKGAGAYESLYPAICRLHLLAEVETAGEALVREPSEGWGLLKKWEARLRMIQPSPVAMEPILEVRRALLKLELATPVVEARKRRALPTAQLKDLLTDYWLQSARVARSSVNLKTAQAFLVSASEAVGSVPEAFLEQAKVYEAEGQMGEAIGSLRRGLAQKFPQLSLSGVTGAQLDIASREQRQTCSKALVLLGRYCWESGAETQEAISAYFETAVRVWSRSESAHYRAAVFHDQTNLQKSSTKPNTVIGMRLVPESTLKRVMGLYAASLRLGSHHAQHSLPRLLNIWLDTAQNAFDAAKHAQSRLNHKRSSEDEKAKLQRWVNGNKNYSKNLTTVALTELSSLPSGQLFPAFSQLISRLVHPCPHAGPGVAQLLARLFRDFPDQALWLTVAVYRTPTSAASQSAATQRQLSDRVDKAKALLRQALHGRPELQHRWDQLLLLCSAFMTFANSNSNRSDPSQIVNMSTAASQLYKFFQGNYPLSPWTGFTEAAEVTGNQQDSRARVRERLRD